MAFDWTSALGYGVASGDPIGAGFTGAAWNSKGDQPYDSSKGPLSADNWKKSITDPMGFAKGVLGMGDGAPNSYDAKGELAKSEAMAGNVYNDAMGQSAWIADHAAPGLFGQGAAIKEQTIQAPGAIQTGTIDAQRIETSPLLQGQQADQLRALQLQQAADAANSPSSAAAQMRAAQGQITQQQLGQAAMARGPERAAMKRDAMLATGTQGMQAANSTAALAAQEQAAKQQAYTGALSNVRAGDVSGGQALTQVGAQNQQADLAAKQATASNQLQAQVATNQQGLTAAQANQNANLKAQQETFANTSDAWKNQLNATNQANQTALQAVGAQNQAQAVASGYGSKQNELEQKNNAGLIGAAGSIVGGLLSDETAKTGIQTIGNQDFLAWQPEPPQETQDSGGGLLGGLGKSLSNLSDEETKRDVSRMGDREIADWAEAVPTAAFRYKPGIDGAPDDGERYHLGTLARQLEGTGPIGKMLVTERPDGLKQVEYGPAALMVGKGALGRANEALDWAKAAYRMAAHGKGLVTRG